MNYYNEHDPKAAAWLRELIAQGAIPPGFVDTRSITQVKPHELAPYTQCHFFAGIGGWSRALELAGWPADRPVWTGSCPCQPFSVAGKQLGKKDPRHLWPAFRRLIGQCRPPIVFGEQVASSAGRTWLNGVLANLERLGYAGAGADLCAAGLGAPHIRQRLYWVAKSNSSKCHTRALLCEGPQEGHPLVSDGSSTHGMGLPDSAGRREGKPTAPPPGHRDTVESAGNPSGMADAASDAGTEQRHQPRGGPRRGATPTDPSECARPCGMADTDGAGCPQYGQPFADGQESTGPQLPSHPSGLGDAERDGLRSCGRPPANQPDQSSFWSVFDVIPCLDGKARRIEPGTFPLADGIHGRVGLLRGYGNAIVPQVAALFIATASEALNAESFPAHHAPLV